MINEPTAAAIAYGLDKGYGGVKDERTVCLLGPWLTVLSDVGGWWQ